MILISGYRFSGKDTLFKGLYGIDNRFRRFAFADALKTELAPFVKELYNIDIFNCTAEEKEKIRPLMIYHGEIRRKEDPLYWVKFVEKQVRQLSPELIPVITDVRYINEYGHFKNLGYTFLVEVRKIPNLPPPPSELLAQPELTRSANYIFEWPNVNGEVEKLRPFAMQVYGEYLNGFAAD